MQTFIRYSYIFIIIGMPILSFCMEQNIEYKQFKSSKSGKRKSKPILRRTVATHGTYKKFASSRELLPIPDITEVIAESSLVTSCKDKKYPLTRGELHKAIECSNVSRVKDLLQNYSINIEHPVSKKISFGDYIFEEEVTPLGLACYLGLPDIAQALIEKNANIDGVFPNPLHLALCAKPPIRFDELDESFIYPHICRNKEKFSLGRVFRQFTQEEKAEESAFRDRQKKCLKLLIANNADVGKNYYSGGTLLHTAAKISAHLIPLLLEYIPVNESKPLDNKNALLELLDHCYNHSIEDVVEATKALLGARADIYQETNLGIIDDIAEKRWDGRSVYTWVQRQRKTDPSAHPELINILLSAIDKQTKELLSIDILKEIFINIGKRDPHILSTLACVSKNWNEATNSAEVTKKVFPTAHRIPLCTLGAQTYHWANAELCEAIIHQDIMTITLFLQDSQKYINPNYICIKKVDVGPLSYNMRTTPMILASQQCNKNIIEALIHAGGKINAPEPYNALIAVVETHSDKPGFKKNQQECVQLLLDNKADINKKNKNGTVLHHAAQCGKAHLMPMLVSEDNVNIQDSNGSTALYKLFENWRMHSASVFTVAVKALLDAKADISIVNKKGKPVEHYAKKINSLLHKGYVPAKHMIKEVSGKPKINESL